MIELDNFSLGEGQVHEVYQRCILVSGKSNDAGALENGDGNVVVEVKDEVNRSSFLVQRWPMCRGYFKALVLLSPGLNKVLISTAPDSNGSTEISVRYTPLLQTPPLHLAVMIAKDSPLLMDCPPAKLGGVSNTHSSLDAAISKFRIAAYMWQALTAEDLRAKGLGRRSFRLEEEWTTDTLSQQSLNSPAAGLVPKVHLIRTDKTVAELRDANLAQQNPRARQRDDLHKIFTNALLAHGAPFTSHAKPVVAGLILDAHYDLSITPKPLILAHAALGCHDPNGLSLGIFGSHLAYSWPRFLEEVPSCLLDPTRPGDTVGNDNGECNTMWQACAVGQGALEPVTPETKHECRWDLRDVLKFRGLRHFWMPGDGELSKEAPSITVEEGDDGKLESMYVEVMCEVGIARVAFNQKGGKQVAEQQAFDAAPVKSLRYPRRQLIEKFGNAKQPLELEVTAMNGQQRAIGNIWNLFKNRSYINVPGTKIRLLKQSVSAGPHAEDEDVWTWAVMLKKRNSQGKLVDASKIDLRVGCVLDGAVVYYKDGETVPCGPRGVNGDPHMGGHQARKLALPSGAEIDKVAVSRDNNDRGRWLYGLRMWLSNGKAMGALNMRCGAQVQAEMLVPPSSHKIIGFYGTSGKYGLCSRFGIVSAPRDAVLPDAVYDMEELQNKPEQDGHRSKRRRTDDDEQDVDENIRDAGDDTPDDSCTSEDEDDNYDDEMDSEMEKWYK
ncbi:putative peptidase family-domain-containing protein [Chaetomium strumarium]|uniref:Peptidase family-domain-containing protein n=1 Tax=Chaetomium strumarium TaxID=1170767 RepID=A0AAJ0GPS6_9PEZI|nr:putative peptidase family-domain-containing protein [Chaetomium strumarium]